MLVHTPSISLGALRDDPTRQFVWGAVIAVIQCANVNVKYMYMNCTEIVTTCTALLRKPMCVYSPIR